MSYEALVLSKGKDKALDRKHPWIFSGAFKNIPSSLRDGQLVEVLDFKNNFKALGFFHPGRIAVKVLSFEKVDSLDSLIERKIEDAIEYRSRLGMMDEKHTNCRRLVFGEADGLPGLIIDQYDHTAVIQIHHSGWGDFLEIISKCLSGKNGIQNVYSKPADKVKTVEAAYLQGSKEEIAALEYDHKFLVDWEDGQKTGFFIDQRENRRRLADFAKGKSVLNTFSYSGGFSIYALAAGASKVVSVDISESAIDLANKNAELNGLSSKHEGITSDVFEYLKQEGENFDILVLDPPAFSKNKRTMHNAVQAYKRLNLQAFKKIKAGGIIFTFSCSQHISPKLFEDTMRAAAYESKREVSILEKLTQPKDHPIRLNYPEGEYLKGLILQVK